MKKVLVSTLAAGLLLSGNSFSEANAAAQKPSDLRVGVRSYQAVLTQNTKAWHNPSNKMVTFYKGRKVTIVERKQVFGYDYLVLKGDYTIPLRDNGVKIIKPLAGKTVYGQFVLSNHAKQLINNAPKSSQYYNAYKKYVISYEKSLFTAFQTSYNDASMHMEFHVDPKDRGGLGGGAPPTKTFNEWMQNKDYTNYKQRHQFKCYPEDKGQTINILSKSFIDGYFYSNNRSYGSFIVGKKVPQNMFSCGISASDEGELSRHKDISVKLKGRYYPTIQSVYITPMKKYTYNQIISTYGKPSSTRFIANGRVEHQLIYNHTKNNGYQIVVALDNYKGNVKYLRKMND